MGLFRLPPTYPTSGLNLELFLNGDDRQTAVRRQRRTLPAEWFPQSGIQLTWPHPCTDWAPILDDVLACYTRLAYEIARREPLLVVHPDPELVREGLQKRLPAKVLENITIFGCPTNDTWARDHAFLTVLDTGGIELTDFRFDGWGGKFEARLDNAINHRLYESGLLQGNYVDALDWELEGGSIESDGLGTILTTAACLLNPNRGGHSREWIETELGRRFGAERVLWLEHGFLSGDDTDSHIDTLARFASEDTIVYVRCTDKDDLHYNELQLMEEELQAMRKADGTAYQLIPVPLPKPIYDEDGERLPATYANFLILNEAVLYPTYAQPEADAEAEAALSRAFPRRNIVGVDCRVLIRQHGSLHCATMQYPRGVFQPHGAESHS